MEVPLSQPPIHSSYSSNLLHYRSNFDNKEYLILISKQSFNLNEGICKYDIENDKYISLANDGYKYPFITPQLSQIISDCDNNQYLMMCNEKNQLSVLNLYNKHYINNYQSIYNQNNNNNNYLLNYLSRLFIQLVILLCLFIIMNCNEIISILLSFIIYSISNKISIFTHKFEKDIKCQFPSNIKFLKSNIYSCYINTSSDGSNANRSCLNLNEIHFICSSSSKQLIHFKFDVQTKQFVALPGILYNDCVSVIIPYKLLFISNLDTMIMFTNSCDIWYYDLKYSEWRVFNDISLPKLPQYGWNINIIIGFGSIVFLFYYRYDSDMHSDDNNDDDTYTYCWDLLLGSGMFECCCKYPSKNVIKCNARNTFNNWTHFVGEHPSPFHFKIELNEEIPVELSIIHLQYYHTLIKQYIAKYLKYSIKLPNDVEMLILDYFPMFL